jgi:hypothetical protein
MTFQLTSLRYSQGTPAKKRTHFYWKILRRWNFNPRQDLKNHVFEHYDLAISEVSHYEFLRGHSSISLLKDHTVGFKKRIQKNKMNSLLWEGVFWGSFELEIIKEL